jgi:hypothetical protein
MPARIRSEIQGDVSGQQPLAFIAVWPKVLCVYRRHFPITGAKEAVFKQTPRLFARAG